MTDVLILEDELTSLQALSEILTTYSDDIRVHKASSLKEAKDLLDQEKEKWKNTSSHDVKEVTPADIAAGRISVGFCSQERYGRGLNILLPRS